MTEIIKLKRGLDIPLKGVASDTIIENLTFSKFSINPADFRFLTPKMLVKAGDKVKAGTPIFCDKLNETHLIVSPTSGTILEVERGDKRKILAIKMEADGLQVSVVFPKLNITELTREQLIHQLITSGLWPFIKQRPYSTIANDTQIPKAIFVSCFNTAPLAPKFKIIVKGDEEAFTMGVEVLKKLTIGQVHINISEAQREETIFKELKNVEINCFSGKHPAGNVGVQIHHINPINKGEVVWTITPEDLIIIGQFINKGTIDMSRTVALTGSEVLTPQYYKTIIGAEIAPIINKNTKGNHNRFISGNVLTGSRITENGFLGYYDNQITIIPEGDHYEFFGWATPGLQKFSFSKTFMAKLLPKKEYALDSNINGGERAYVITGEFEKVLPMDIYPMQLIKAILAEDIDMMENLGIYEVEDEDFALCEYICTSKTNIQQIIRNGLELLRREMI